MKLDSLKPKQHSLLILTPQDAEKSIAPKLLKAIKRKKYQDPNTIWHAVLVMPPVWFYKSYDSKKYQEDYSAITKLHYEVRLLLKIPYENVHFTYDIVSNVIHDFMERYSGICLPFNRGFLKNDWLLTRWYWRKIKRYFRKLNIKILRYKFLEVG